MSVAVLGLTNCRADPSSSSAPTPTATASSANKTDAPILWAELVGWWVDPSGTGWSFTQRAIREQSSTVHTHWTVTATSDGHVDGVRALTFETNASKIIVRRSERTLAVTLDDTTTTLRRAIVEEARRFEKLDQQAMLADPTLCDRARRCCAALLAKKLATDADCNALVSVPEIGRCDRALGVFALKAKGDDALVAACSK